MLRIVSTTAILGYGFPKQSLLVACNTAAKLAGATASKSNNQRDIVPPSLIAADAGSIDPGPYYLASGESFTDDAAVERDLSLMYQAAQVAKCPVVIGSCHGAGADPHLEKVFQISKRLLPKSTKIAVISAEVPHAVVRRKFEEKKLKPLGPLMQTDLQGTPTHIDRALKYLDKSVVVAQMGFNGIAKALAEGADVVLAGRTYDPACFAALPLLKNNQAPAPAAAGGSAESARYDVGLALHMGKILECGAIACDPGSGSDVLVCDLEPDTGTATFWCPNPARTATARSVSAHTLYEKSEAHRFGLPGGLLLTHMSRFDEDKQHKTVALSGSAFYPLPLQLKLEGAFMAGHRYVSVLQLPPHIINHQTQAALLSYNNELNTAHQSSVVYYGINGVESTVIPPTTPTPGAAAAAAAGGAGAAAAVQELGIIVKVSSSNKKHAKSICALVRSTMLHFGYAGRKSTAGNLAFPFSPSDCSYIDDKKTGLFYSAFIAGTRDPVFVAHWDQVREGVLNTVASALPAEFANSSIHIELGGNHSPPTDDASKGAREGQQSGRGGGRVGGLFALIETVSDEAAQAQHNHNQAVAALNSHLRQLGQYSPTSAETPTPTPTPTPSVSVVLDKVYTGQAACFSMQHLMDVDTDSNEEAELFPVRLYEFCDKANDWTLKRTVESTPLQLHKSPLLDPSVDYSADDLNLGDHITAITGGETHEKGRSSQGKENSSVVQPTRKLSDFARVIRSKNAGINEITYDVMFHSEADLDYAVSSGLFSPTNIARAFYGDNSDSSIKRVLGSFRDSKALSIKFTLVRDRVVGDFGERDVYGAQQARSLFDWEL